MEDTKTMLINAIVEYMGKDYNDAEEYAKLLTNKAYLEYVQLVIEESTISK